MQLTQGFLPTSSGLKDNILNQKFSEPDNFDGYELGTWDLDHGNFFRKVCSENSNWNWSLIKIENKLPGSVSIYHIFTEEERTSILEALKNEWTHKLVKKTEARIWSGENWAGHKNGFGLHEKWYKRLCDLFSNPDDLPIWYFYD